MHLLTNTAMLRTLINISLNIFQSKNPFQRGILKLYLIIEENKMVLWNMGFREKINITKKTMIKCIKGKLNVGDTCKHIIQQYI